MRGWGHICQGARSPPATNSDVVACNFANPRFVAHLFETPPEHMRTNDRDQNTHAPRQIYLVHIDRLSGGSINEHLLAHLPMVEKTSYPSRRSRPAARKREAIFQKYVGSFNDVRTVMARALREWNGVR